VVSQAQSDTGKEKTALFRPNVTKCSAFRRDIAVT
jgi:hypothetical protein